MLAFIHPGDFKADDSPDCWENKQMKEQHIICSQEMHFAFLKLLCSVIIDWLQIECWWLSINGLNLKAFAE